MTSLQLAQLDAKITESRQLTRTSQNQGYLDRLQRSYSWLRKSRRVAAKNDRPDHEARFIYSWIAFNALYGVRRADLPSLQKDTMALIRKEARRLIPPERLLDPLTSLRVGTHEPDWLIAKLCLRDAQERGFSDIVGDEYLQQSFWDGESFETVSRLRDLDKALVREARRGETPLLVLHIVLWRRLWILRNQIFHGASTDRESRRRSTPEKEKKFVAAVDLLDQMVEALLAVMEQCDKRNWPRIPFPRSGTVEHDELLRGTSDHKSPHRR